MRAGRLRHRVEIQTATEVADSYGELDKTWATTKTVWAAVEPLRGAEALTVSQTQGQTSHRVVMRHQTGVGPDNRLKFGTRILAIDSVLNFDERNRQLELLCTEAV